MRVVLFLATYRFLMVAIHFSQVLKFVPVMHTTNWSAMRSGQ